VGDLPAFDSSGYHAEFHEGYQKHTNPLSCRTSMGTAWARHGMWELALNHLQFPTLNGLFELQNVNDDIWIPESVPLQ
jgi:hypothetical protein